MKHDELHAIAHNFAESLASGVGFVVGHREMYDASISGIREITVRFVSVVLDYHAFPLGC